MDKNKRIIVTGATGLVGSYLVRTLIDRGFSNLVGFRRKTSNFNLLGGVEHHITWVEGDILDLDFLQDSICENDILIHTAALVSFATKDLDLLQSVNVEGTSNLVNVALDKGVAHFIHISSVAALGRVKSGTVISEQTEWSESKENSAYALSKHYAELEVWRGHAEGLKVAIINPSIILGGGYWHEGSTSIIGTSAKGLPYFPKGGTGIVDVRDIVKLIFLLLEKGVDGERFICNGHNLTYKSLFQGLANALNVKGPNKVLPDFLGSIAWRAAWFKSLFTGGSPMLTKSTVRTSKFTSIYSNKKSTQLGLSYRPLEDTFSDIGAVYKPNQKFALLSTDTE